MKDVSIIFVNYNTSKMVLECIESVEEKTKEIDYEVIIVDNASDKNNIAILESIANKYNTIFSDTNLGFGKANNLGAMQAKGKYLFFLNGDTLLINNAIKVLYDYLENNPQCGVVGGNLYDEEHNHTQSYERSLPSVANIFKNFVLPSKFSFANRIGNYYYNQTEEIIEVGYITGADMMMPKELFDRIGGFDKDFFMYCEESELCHRVTKIGYKIMNVPHAKIIHFEGASIKVEEGTFNARRFKLMTTESQFLFYSKVHGKKSVKLFYYMTRLAYFIHPKFYMHRVEKMEILKHGYKEWKQKNKKQR